ncbi:hypothetical protein CH63R_01718 [Colletotrichum higginsianum IMI 349063]|uniref:Uncharacterized protein n=1 Tax=Colletotrichum higginsianum (strain IMI 349063) TaxID=759273 RepID=A0A1B7YXF7_COLHI|nr:hypothetical protein CH63R_01718 [Colletotrichum higginsianum IMI 349063]OBR16538.1 hypothetical protein CH63R_01718 [Colletotrichum higginsianum IMI 349063]
MNKKKLFLSVDRRRRVVLGAHSQLSESIPRFVGGLARLAVAGPWFGRRRTGLSRAVGFLVVSVFVGQVVQEKVAHPDEVQDVERVARRSQSVENLESLRLGPGTEISDQLVKVLVLPLKVLGPVQKGLAACRLGFRVPFAVHPVGRTSMASRPGPGTLKGWVKDNNISSIALKRF